MIKIELICIGKLKENYLTLACKEYVKRLSVFCKLNIIELPEYKCLSLNNYQIKNAIKKEGDLILKRLDQNSFSTALCIEGESISSEIFSQKIAKLSLDGISKLSFIIGGAYGLCTKVKQKSDFKLSLSSMTFPHQLTRIIFLEQLYRSFTIISGTNYHK